MKGVKKVKKRILDFMKKADPSGTNVKIYKEKFKKMTDKEIYKWIENDGPIKVYTKPFEIEPTIEDAKNACEEVDVPTEEHITLPYLYSDDDVGDVISDHPVTLLYINFKRLQQMIFKENSSSSDITIRDKTNQAVRDSKSAQLNDREVANLAIKGYDNIITELLSFRADHTLSKEEAYENIKAGNSTNIPDSIHDPDGKTAVSYLHVMLLGMGISSDIIEPLEDL